MGFIISYPKSFNYLKYRRKIAQGFPQETDVMPQMEGRMGTGGTGTAELPQQGFNMGEKMANYIINNLDKENPDTIDPSWLEENNKNMFMNLATRIGEMNNMEKEAEILINKVIYGQQQEVVDDVQDEKFVPVEEDLNSPESPLNIFTTDREIREVMSDMLRKLTTYLLPQGKAWAAEDALQNAVYSILLNPEVVKEITGTTPRKDARIDFFTHDKKSKDGKNFDFRNRSLLPESIKSQVNIDLMSEDDLYKFLSNHQIDSLVIEHFKNLLYNRKDNPDFMKSLFNAIKNKALSFAKYSGDAAIPGQKSLDFVTEEGTSVADLTSQEAAELRQDEAGMTEEGKKMAQERSNKVVRDLYLDGENAILPSLVDLSDNIKDVLVESGLEILQNENVTPSEKSRAIRNMNKAERLDLYTSLMVGNMNILLRPENIDINSKGDVTYRSHNLDRYKKLGKEKGKGRRGTYFSVPTELISKRETSVNPETGEPLSEEDVYSKTSDTFMNWDPDWSKIVPPAQLVMYLAETGEVKEAIKNVIKQVTDNGTRIGNGPKYNMQLQDMVQYVKERTGNLVPSLLSKTKQNVSVDDVNYFIETTFYQNDDYIKDIQGKPYVNKKGKEKQGITAHNVRWIYFDDPEYLSYALDLANSSDAEGGLKYDSRVLKVFSNFLNLRSEYTGKGKNKSVGSRGSAISPITGTPYVFNYYMLRREPIPEEIIKQVSSNLTKANKDAIIEDAHAYNYHISKKVKSSSLCGIIYAYESAIDRLCKLAKLKQDSKIFKLASSEYCSFDEQINKIKNNFRELVSLHNIDE